MHDSIGIKACFSSRERPSSVPATITRAGQSVFMLIYRTKLAGQCRLITITWCKNVLLQGLSVSVQAETGNQEEYQCKDELKPWCFWRKQGSKQLVTDGRRVDVVWDLKAAKFNGETEPQSDYYVAIVCEGEVVLLLGDLKKEAYRKTKCRPALIEPMLVSRKEHVFGKKIFITRIDSHEISIECSNNISSKSFDPELEIKVDGELAIQVKHLQWKFRGNEAINVSKSRRVQVYWDVHDWLFGSGPRHGLFIFNSSMPLLNVQQLPFPPLQDDDDDTDNVGGSFSLCLFLYTWKVE